MFTNLIYGNETKDVAVGHVPEQGEQTSSQLGANVTKKKMSERIDKGQKQVHNERHQVARSSNSSLSMAVRRQRRLKDHKFP